MGIVIKDKFKLSFLSFLVKFSTLLLAYPQFFVVCQRHGNNPTWASRSERLHRPDRFRVGHSGSSAIQKAPQSMEVSYLTDTGTALRSLEERFAQVTKGIHSTHQDLEREN
ncbi:MAG: hypothetical protein ABSG71_12920 [Thermodesulfobacteriota bacterium]|jgi:hypothetical protein